jgi:hypothetical protein
MPQYALHTIQYNGWNHKVYLTHVSWAVTLCVRKTTFCYRDSKSLNLNSLVITWYCPMSGIEFNKPGSFGYKYNYETHLRSNCPLQKIHHPSCVIRRLQAKQQHLTPSPCHCAAPVSNISVGIIHKVLLKTLNSVLNI